MHQIFNICWQLVSCWLMLLMYLYLWFYLWPIHVKLFKIFLSHFEDPFLGDPLIVDVLPVDVVNQVLKQTN